MPRKRRRISESQTTYFPREQPPFVSTPDEIRRAVEKSAISRGILLIKVIVRMNIDGLLETIQGIHFDREEIAEKSEELGIDSDALMILDSVIPRIPYTYYFCQPKNLVENPELIMYYRNIAMLSRKVMNGIGLPTENYEEHGVIPSEAVAKELTSYFNQITSKLVKISGITPLRHLEIVLSNIGDALGGISRNEVERTASAQIMRWLLIHLHKMGYVDSILFSLKGSLESIQVEEETEEENSDLPTSEITFTPEMNLEKTLSYLETNRVKYREIRLKNGNGLLLDRQITWRDVKGDSYRIGPDLHSRSDQIDMIWAGEIKGGADPAGSDEHWKTATKAIQRVIDAAAATGRSQPKLSFLATILVDRVAEEAQDWINQGKLTSVYNLTKISESETELRKFLDDIQEFLGYAKEGDELG